MEERAYLRVEDLDVHQKLCALHLEICDLSHAWPSVERYELGSQIRRSSNSSPAQLAEKNDDRHVRNKIEGVNRARGEAAETIHHLFMAKMKGYVDSSVFDALRARYEECIRMLTDSNEPLNGRSPKLTADGRSGNPNPRWTDGLRSPDT